MTIRSLLEETVFRFPEAVACQYFRQGEWRSHTYAVLQKRIRQLAEAFHGLGFTPEFPHVSLFFDNSPEWVEAYLALTGSRLSVVPMDPKLRSSEVEYILGSAKVYAVFTDTAHLPLLRGIAEKLPCLKLAVIVDGKTKEKVDLTGLPFTVIDYEELRAKTGDRPTPWYDAQKPLAQDVASIIYTSGTTGKPKGAMLTHLNFCSDALGCFDAIETSISTRDVFLIVLPFFHALAFLTNLVVPIVKGSSMAFVRSLRTVSEDMQVLRPTVLIAVPLLAEKMFEKIRAKISKNTIARLLLRIGLGHVVGHSVRKGMGGRLRLMIVGGAPCPRGVLRGFYRLGIPLVEGYGLTECSPVICVNSPRERGHVGSIGRKFPNIEVRIAHPDKTGVGELQVRGPIVMKGYFLDLAATRDAFEEEWFCTGDLAVMDEAGRLRICGRKKALIVNREGKNIYPEEVENVIAHDPMIDSVVVIGYTVGKEPGEHIGAIVSPNRETIAAENGGVEPPWAEIESSLRRRIHECCRAGLADYKHPRKIVFQREPLERTSIQKVRRCVYQGKLNEA